VNNELQNGLNRVTASNRLRDEIVAERKEQRRLDLQTEANSISKKTMVAAYLAIILSVISLIISVLVLVR